MRAVPYPGWAPGMELVRTMAGQDGEPRWLDEHQQHLWRMYLGGTAVVEERLTRQLESEVQLSLSEYEVMVRLSEAPGRRMRMSQLASELVHSRSRVTYTVRSMERRGLVERTACAEDKRGVLCALTDHGWQVLRRAAPGHVAAVRAVLVDVLTQEQFEALGEAMTVVWNAATREVDSPAGQVAR